MAQAHGRPTYDAYYASGDGGGRAHRSHPRKTVKPLARPKAAGRKPAVISSIDPKRGVPSFLWAKKGAPEARGGGETPPEAARAYLGRFASLYDMSRADADTARVVAVHDTGRGPIIVTMKQRVGDIEVFRSDVKVMLGRDDRSLLAISGSPHAASSRVARLGGPGEGFLVGREAALANAFGDLFGVSVDPGAFRDSGHGRGDYRHFDVVPAAFGLTSVAMRTSPRVKQVYFPLPDRLVPAYYLELEAQTKTGGEAYAYVVAADDGRVLYRANLTAYEAPFTYRVFADDNLARNYPPTDGPLEDVTPFPQAFPTQTELRPGFIEPRLVTTAGFNKTCDPWLASGATFTSGNNVDAYADHDEGPGATPTDPPVNDGNDPEEPGELGNDPDPSNDPTAEATAANTFDYAFDKTLDASALPQTDTAESAKYKTQYKAAITQLFYVNNWMHDFWYDSGFDEASGVAQKSNFGRVKDEAGNVVTDGEGDAIEAQAQDGLFAGNRNNANMSTPDDGAKPRMQMFLFDGRVLSKELSATAGLPAAITDNLVTSSFGPKNYELTGVVVVANDGVAAPANPPAPAGTVTDGCEAFAAGSLAGKIAIIDRGLCGFAVKAKNAQDAGAIGVIIANNGNPAPSTLVNPDRLAITIPGAMLAVQADADALKAAAAAGEVSVTIKRSVDNDYDGTIDNLISSHEWGHYWHHRLVRCGGPQCSGMSEGWGDFNAIMLSIKEGDDLARAYGMATYATGASKDSAYFGIRRFPYSTDPQKNPLTFKHIADTNKLPIAAGSTVPYNPEFFGAPDPEDPEQNPVPLVPNAESHNVGEIWASTLFDAYAKLLAAHPFDIAKRRMADYVVGGMKLAPVEPTFTQQRDAILSYVFNSDDADYELFAEAFVNRGMGVGAISPPVFGGATDPDSGDPTFEEVVEDNTRKGDIAFDLVELEESVRSCDGDGVVDADETGQLSIRIRNAGMSKVDAANVTVSTTTPGVTFANGGKATSAALDPYGNLTVRVDATLAANVNAQGEVPFTVKADSATSFTANIETSLLRRTNYDEAPAQSKLDTVETKITPWTGGANEVSGSGGELVWDRVPDPAAGAKVNNVWHADDSGFLSDASITTPDIVVPAGGKLTLTFNHRFSFETGPAEPGGPDVFWDGGVLEYAEVGGAGGELVFQDVTKLAGANPGYGGKIGFAEAGNPLLDRDGFTGKSTGFPALQTTTVNFGTTLAGKTVRFRFRVGTDEASGDYGWDVDNIAVTGASNLPFPLIVPDAGDCTGVPTVDAGADQSVAASAAVTLGATGTDPGGKALTYAWEQVDGPEVALTGGDGAAPTFTAPKSYRPSTLVFRVKASNGGKGFGADTVTVNVAGDSSVVSGGMVGSVAQCNPAAAGAAGAGGSNGGGASGAGGATAGGPNNPGGGGDDDDGCGCSTVGSQPTRGAWLAAIAAGLAFVRRRRRKG